MNKLKYLGIPFHYGQPHAEVSHAPDVLRSAGLLKELEEDFDCQDLGNILFPVTSNMSSSCNKKISETIARLDLDEAFLLNVGGDHGMALGTIHGILCHRPETVVIWADAHGDINTPESSITGNFHGMPLAYLLHLCDVYPWMKQKLSSHHLIYFGPRDLDPAEEAIIQTLGILYFSSETINRFGAKNLIKNALRMIDPQEILPIHLSFDVDVLDPHDIGSTGTRVDAGPKLKEVEGMLDVLASTSRLRSMDVVELNVAIGSQMQIKDSVHLVKNLILRTLRLVALRHQKTCLEEDVYCR